MKRVLLEDRPSSVDVADRRGRSAGVAAEARARRHVGDVARPVDVEFSLAIHTHTGKYFIGRDILAAAPDLVGDVYYWLLARRSPPTGLFGKVVGRLAHIHACATTQGGPLMRRLPRRVPGRPLLHLDPFSVGTAALRPCDAVLIHDLGPLTHPELFDPVISRVYLPIYQEIARVGPHLVFVSQTSEREFWRLFPSARAASRRVIYPAIRAEVGGGAEEAPAGVGGRFLLTVGSIGTRKNQLRSLRAFAASRLAARGVCYVLCGGREPGYEPVAELARATPGAVLLPYVTDRQLAWLYRAAEGFVLTSLLEGFGIPVAEAISRGLVPLVSASGVLEEVAGDQALLADPEDEPAIAEGMRRLVDMDETERQRRRLGLRAAIGRFEPAGFARDWRQALADIGSGS